MNCFDSKVSFVNRYIWYVNVPLEMKKTRTCASIIHTAVRCSVCTWCGWRHDVIMHHASSCWTWMNTGLPGYCIKGIPVPRVLCHSLIEVTKVPGKVMGILQNLQKFRVRVRKCYRSHTSSGYCGTGVQNSQKFQTGTKMLYPYPGYCGTGGTELT